MADAQTWEGHLILGFKIMYGNSPWKNMQSLLR